MATSIGALARYGRSKGRAGVSGGADSSVMVFSGTLLDLFSV